MRNYGNGRLRGIWYYSGFNCWRFDKGQCVIHQCTGATPIISKWGSSPYIATGIANVRLA